MDKVNCTVPLGKSDHVCIEFNYLTGVEVKPEHVGKRNYWKADYGAITKELHGVDWEQIFKNKDIAGMWKSFRDKVVSSCEKHVPLKKPYKKVKSSWMTKETLKEIKKSARIYR